MPRRAARITKAEIARALHAAKEAGATEVELRLGQPSSIFIRLSSIDAEEALEPSEEIVL